jgi:acid phosphatase type 7
MRSQRHHCLAKLSLWRPIAISVVVATTNGWAGDTGTNVRVLGAGPAPRMIKGPYLQNVTPTSMSIMWQMQPGGDAKVLIEGPAEVGGASVTRSLVVRKADQNSSIAEAKLTGLVPSSRYRYQVQPVVDGADGADGAGGSNQSNISAAAGQTWTGEFATAPPVGASSPFSFAVFGDSRQNAEAHRRVVDRISQDVPDFLLGTGDMVDDGAKQDQWQTFFDVERPLLRDNVYFPSIGNHDRQGRGRTADSYRNYFSVPDNGTDAERYYAFSYANARFLVLDSNSHSFSLTDQTAWIDHELAAARQDKLTKHIFVVMHHPPYSISLHRGHRDLRERWTPLFEQYDVSAVFSGHDHVYERAEKNGIRYFVSGGGGAPLYPRSPKAQDVDKDAVLRFERAYHYLRVNVSASQVEVSAIRVDGTLIETTSWQGPSAGPIANLTDQHLHVGPIVGTAPSAHQIGGQAPGPTGGSVVALSVETPTVSPPRWPLYALGAGLLGSLALVFGWRSRTR